jgi:hypothetical protein
MATGTAGLRGTAATTQTCRRAIRAPAATAIHAAGITAMGASRGMRVA